jgi:hypothetical protein
VAKKTYDWEQAKALYGMGKTPRQIEHELKIPKTSVERTIIRDGWIKGELGQVVQDVVRVSEVLGQKSGAERGAVQNEAERILKAKGYIENVTLMGLKRLSQLLPVEPKISEVKAGIEGAKTAMVTLGVVDYYPPQKLAIEHTGEQNKTVTIIHAPEVKRVD